MRSIIVMILLLFCASNLNATHVRGGEFRYIHVSGYTYSIEFHYYTRLSSPADRPELIFAFGDGTMDTVPRIMIQDNPMGISCYGDLRFSIYQKNHTFPGPGIYVITMEDQNRNGGIANIPNSVAETFCVSTTLVISDVLGPNNSVVFNSPQPLIIQTGWDFFHDLDPYDQDGDSLSFELIQASGLGCGPIAGYQFPSPGFTLDPENGNWSWSSASILGEYNVTVLATEWRDGQMIGQVIRDMSVCVQPFGVSIAEHFLSSITISPTLTDGLIRINNSSSEQFQITILSTSGAVIMATGLPPGEQHVDLTGYADGEYFIRLNDRHGTSQATRIVKY